MSVSDKRSATEYGGHEKGGAHAAVQDLVRPWEYKGLYIEYLGTFSYACICAYMRVHSCICVYACVCVYMLAYAYSGEPIQLKRARGLLAPPLALQLNIAKMVDLLCICVYMRVYAYICVYIVVHGCMWLYIDMFVYGFMWLS